MLHRLRQSPANLWIVALYALAISTLGLAHRPIIHDAGAGALAAYALPDGTLPTLCLRGGDNRTDHAPAHGAVTSRCDACAIAHAPGLIDPPQVFAPAPGCSVSSIVAWAAPAGQFTLAARHAPTSRGPPRA
ncbi:MAG: hypothetical protein ACK5JM_03020 [Rhodoblastus sp.]